MNTTTTMASTSPSYLTTAMTNAIVVTVVVAVIFIVCAVFFAVLAWHNGIYCGITCLRRRCMHKGARLVPIGNNSISSQSA